MPIPLKNIAISGFIIRILTVIPTAAEIITDGIKLIAVCTISCPVVKPRAFKIP